ncbi:MAG: ATP-binding protein [Eubacteriales bacterium]|nr:ATP-binding protein [Eubacteriales bacterium]
MTRKTLRKILSFGVSVIAITAVVVVAIFYSYSESQVKENLHMVESIVEAELNQNGEYEFLQNSIDEKTRVTLIAADGTVLADSMEDASKMGNHSDREEFQEAVSKGESSCLRQSETLNESTYYYAKLLDNGNVLRVSTTASETKDFFSNILLYVVISLICVIAVSVAISVGITKSIVKPFEDIEKNLDNLDAVETDAELKPLVDALKEQKKRQKALDKQKKQFTANVSHELKTPLTSIAGYAELIETGMAKPEDVKPFASVIRKQALRLVSLSEDIIQLSQLEESDEQKIVFESVDIYEICKKCVEALSINAKNKNVTLTLEGENCYVKGNGSLLEELVYNLCDNAIRYNKENGSVTISVVPEDDGVKLTVKDTGIGIPDKYQERIFERFFRVDKSRSKATGGTGLGLAIVKHIAQQHDAKLTLNSVLGEGTEISILLKK